MNEENSKDSGLADLGADLERSFAPAWVREAGAPTAKQAFSFPEELEDRRREKRFSGKPSKGERPRRDHGAGKKPRDSGRKGPREPRSGAPKRQPPSLVGWNLRFRPVEQGVIALAKRLKESLRAYPLFDLARLVLNGPERYHVEFTKDSSANPPAQELFQCVPDQTLWLSEAAATDRVLLSEAITQFYLREEEAVEPPKGNFPVVARCGVTGVLLGPPNHHSYQTQIRRHFQEKIRNLPFEAFSSKISMERSEEAVEEWKQSMASIPVWRPVGSAENEEVGGEVFRDFAAVRAHFRSVHAAGCTQMVSGKVEMPGVAVAESDRAVVQRVREEWEQLRRFPLPVANQLSAALSKNGLQIFKTGKNITYAGPARPRHLNRETQTVSPALSRLLDCLTEHARRPRNEQWHALTERFAADSENPAAPAFVKDLMWLLREGYVVDFHGGNLSVTPKPQRNEPAENPAQ